MVAAREAVVSAANDYVVQVKELREHAGGRLINIVGGSAPATYPVHCLRVAEAAALIYLLSDKEEERARGIEFLRKIIVTETAAQHPISDRYAVSIVASVRALRAAGEEDIALGICARRRHGCLHSTLRARGSDPWKTPKKLR
jgi:hypothetical protein